MNRIKSLSMIAVLVVIGSFTLSACSAAAAPTGLCGWIVGNGTYDRKIHKIVYPDSNPDIGSDNEAHYVPCGPRNYRVTDGSKKDLEGHAIGDLTSPYVATTKDKTPVLVQVDAFWQLNQSEGAFKKFAELCNKYKCYTTDTDAGEANFATKGWNGMLQENFSPSVDDALQDALKEIPDSIWKDNDRALYKQLDKVLADKFMEAVRVTTGYNEDLFCGSGNSGWDNPKEHDKFTCTNVRFRVTEVTPKDKQTQASANTASQEEVKKDANQSRYNSSVPLYGKQTNYWLGVQDSVKGCPSGATCNFYLKEQGQ